MIATSVITDKKQLELIKQKIENRLKEIGKDWAYIQKATQLDASVIQKLLALKGITEEDLDKIMKAIYDTAEKVAKPEPREPQPKITPKEEKTEKITQKWDYEKFKERLLQELREKGMVTNKDIEKWMGKPASYWAYYIKKMEKEELIVGEIIPELTDKGKKYIKVYRAGARFNYRNHLETFKEFLGFLGEQELLEIYKHLEKLLKTRISQKLESLTLEQVVKILESLS